MSPTIGYLAQTIDEQPSGLLLFWTIVRTLVEQQHTIPTGQHNHSVEFPPPTATMT